MYTRIEVKKGFTLLELLIVIAIIAILSAILIFVLNPAETLRKGRDSQRISDFATVNTAIALLLTEKGGLVTPADLCGNSPVGVASTTTSTVFLSIPNTTNAVEGCGTGAADFEVQDNAAGYKTTGILYGQVTAANLNKNDGTGWLPVNLTQISGGAPINVMPVDPTNSIAKRTTNADCPEPHSDATAAIDGDLYYTYVCKGDLSWEINGVLESTQFVVTDNRDGTDGGNSATVYEVGTNLNLMKFHNNSAF